MRRAAPFPRTIVAADWHVGMYISTSIQSFTLNPSLHLSAAWYLDLARPPPTAGPDPAEEPPCANNRAGQCRTHILLCCYAG